MSMYTPNRGDRGHSSLASAIGAAFGDGIVPTTGSVPTARHQRSRAFRLFPWNAKPKKDDISGA